MQSELAAKVERFELRGGQMTSRKDGTWVRLTTLSSCERRAEKAEAQASQAVERAEKAERDRVNHAREDLCLRHEAFNPEGDCLVCDKEQADKRALASFKNALEAALATLTKEEKDG